MAQVGRCSRGQGHHLVLDHPDPGRGQTRIFSPFFQADPWPQCWEGVNSHQRPPPGELRASLARSDGGPSGHCSPRRRSDGRQAHGSWAGSHTFQEMLRGGSAHQSPCPLALNLPRARTPAGSLMPSPTQRDPNHQHPRTVIWSRKGQTTCFPDRCWTWKVLAIEGHPLSLEMGRVRRGGALLIELGYSSRPRRQPRLRRSTDLQKWHWGCPDTQQGLRVSGFVF